MGLILQKHLKVVVMAEDTTEAAEILSKHANLKIRGFELRPFNIAPGESGNGTYTYYSQVVRKFGTKNVTRARGDFR